MKALFRIPLLIITQEHSYIETTKSITTRFSLYSGLKQDACGAQPWRTGYCLFYSYKIAWHN